MGRWDITATKQMKKLITLFVVVFATCVLFAQEKQYLIKVNYSVVYEFRDYAGRVLSSQSGYDSYATFTVCAETEGEARQKAIEQCSSVCSYGGQKVGSAEIGGVKCTKYEVRRIKGAQDISPSHPDC